MARLFFAVLLSAGMLMACGSDAPDSTGDTSDDAPDASQVASQDGPQDRAGTSNREIPATLPDSTLTPPSDTTARRFAAAMHTAHEKNLAVRPVGEVMQVLGQEFGGAPYLEGTLDEPPEETLVVRFDGFDCVTYVETLLAMARGVVQNDTTYAGFARRLAQIRYRSGTPMGYCSRLHYFSDWIRDNDRSQLVRDVTPDIANRTFRDSIDFMSTHRDAYVRFATNDSLLACVREVEGSLARAAAERPLRYVSQDSIRAVYGELRAGDVIAIVTNVDGLDIAHTGLAYVSPPGGAPDTSEGSVGLLHASLSDGVVVSPDLQRYVQQIGHMIGIVVARPQPVNSSTP